MYRSMAEPPIPPSSAVSVSPRGPHSGSRTPPIGCVSQGGGEQACDQGASLDVHMSRAFI